jgi:hypothetical protein
VSDGRVRQGRDHPVTAVLALAAAAVVAGMKGYTAITGWVADVKRSLLPPHHYNELVGMCDEISQRIVVHVSGIGTLNPEFIYRNVWKAIHTYQPTCRRKSAG